MTPVQTERTAPYGYCQCGCGRKTKVAYRNIRQCGHVKGQPVLYLPGHNGRGDGPDWLPQDLGHETPCWIWQRRIESNGYGSRRVEGTNYRAHRWAWIAAHGEDPEGFHVHHRCEVRACVNPDHLVAVRPPEHKRRHATLTHEQVEAVRASLREFSGYGACTRLAKEYGVMPKTINDIKHGKTWGVI